MMIYVNISCIDIFFSGFQSRFYYIQ